MNRTSLKLCIIISISLLIACKGKNKASRIDSITTGGNVVQVVERAMPGPESDSVKLTALIRKLYKWRQTDTLKHDGFKPLKRNANDTLYTSIDLDENQKAIEELKQTGLFASPFLNDYRRVAERMDKELRDGSSLWPEGELSTFGDDSDEWCNCQDFPVDDYWNIITLTKIKITGNEANFKWTWGGNYFYDVKAIKEDGNWKISYLQGFDMKAYSWEWWKKNQKAKS